MALDTSAGAYEMLFDTPENSDKYYEGYVEMRGQFRKWTKYWCVLKKKNLHFFKDINTQIKEHYKGYFPLEGTVEIELETKNYEWQMIKKDKKKITLRTQNQILRDSWINSFRMSMRGEPASKESYILPGSGPASPKHQILITESQNLSPPTSPTKNSLQNDVPPPTPPNRPPQTRKMSSAYPIQPGQKEVFAKHAEKIAAGVEMTEADRRLQNRLLTGDRSWHQASMRREDAEKVLSSAENGSFIVREYIDVLTSKNKGYVISLKDNESQIRHHKILRVRDGGLVINGHEVQTFDTLPNLLVFFIASQRKTIDLIPYTEGYEVMAGSTNQCRQQSRPLGRSATVKEQPTSHPSPLKARSQSVYHNRILPAVPSGRPLLPPQAANGESDDGSYLEPADEGRLPEETDSSSYVHMQSPRKLPPIPSETEGYEVMTRSTNQCGQQSRPLEAPLSPGDGSYVNVQSPSYRSYENVEPSPEEQAPKLPPKKRSLSFQEERPYVNLPTGIDRPPRRPLRKAHTIER